MKEIVEYFPELNESQLIKFQALKPLYDDWNKKINVISRKDIDHFYTRHVLHSLAIAKYVYFSPGTKIMDIGTGGGFPGIPLAIFFPDCEFLLVDSIGKKIKVVNNVIQSLNLGNAHAYHGRAEEVKQRFNFVTCRAVAHIQKLLAWTAKSYLPQDTDALPNGLLALKGGNLNDELSDLQTHYDLQRLSSYFSDDFFDTKQLVYVQNI